MNYDRKREINEENQSKSPHTLLHTLGLQVCGFLTHGIPLLCFLFCTLVVCVREQETERHTHTFNSSPIRQSQTYITPIAYIKVPKSTMFLPFFTFTVELQCFLYLPWKYHVPKIYKVSFCDIYRGSVVCFLR